MATPTNSEILPAGYERNQYGNIVKKSTPVVPPIAPVDAGLASTLSQVPTYDAVQPSFLDRVQATFTGTSPFKYTTGTMPDNRIGYIDNTGKQAYTGELATYDDAGNKTGLNTEALNAANALGSNAFGTSGQTGTGLAGTLSSGWDSIGGAKGFADLASGLGTLGSLYTGYQANKRADKEMDALNEERARIKRKEEGFSKGLAAGGITTYTAGAK